MANGEHVNVKSLSVIIILSTLPENFHHTTVQKVLLWQLRE